MPPGTSRPQGVFPFLAASGAALLSLEAWKFGIPFTSNRCPASRPFSALTLGAWPQCLLGEEGLCPQDHCGTHPQPSNWVLANEVLHPRASIGGSYQQFPTGHRAERELVVVFFLRGGGCGQAWMIIFFQGFWA